MISFTRSMGLVLFNAIVNIKQSGPFRGRGYERAVKIQRTYYRRERKRSLLLTNI